MTEQQKFDAAMKKILSVSKQELKRRLEEEKRLKSTIWRDMGHAQPQIPAG